MERQVARSTETAKAALRHITDLSRRVELLEKKHQGLKSQLSKMVMARDLAVAESRNRQGEVKAPEPRVRMLDDELDSLKRRG